MRSNNNSKSLLAQTGLAAAVLVLASSAALAQQAVNLAAGPATATLPDGSALPMWGYSCGAVVSGSTATCARLNPNGSGWSPVVITIPTGQDLQINLANNLSFASGANLLPTSLTIVGQLGGGLGSSATTTPSPDHSNAQPGTWPIANTTPGNAAPVGVGIPPPQGPRVQSFATEVAGGATASLCWGVCGGAPSLALKPGTYLIESGTHPSIQGPMGLYGMLVVTSAPTSTTTANTGTAYPGVSYSAEVPLLMSEIDPVQNAAVQAAVATAGFKETNVWAGFTGNNNQTALCRLASGASAPNGACYPPAVNYTPLYYLFNGVAFDRTNSAASVFAATPTGSAATPVAGDVLVRFVNAGLRMHVPSIVGSLTGTTAVSGFSLIAEDGNPLPGTPRVQSEVFLAAGKTYDVKINTPASTATALPVYDRQLSLSGNATVRDAGMLAYLGINGAGLPTTGVFSAAATAIAAPVTANTYYCSVGHTLAVTDPGQGVLRGAQNAKAATLDTVNLVGGAPALAFNNNGTFTYAAQSGTCGGSFTYLINGSVTATAVVSECDANNQSPGCVLAGAPVASDVTFTSTVWSRYASSPPGVLGSVKNVDGVSLTAAAAGSANFGITLNADGSFTADRATSNLAACPATAAAGSFCTSFSYVAKNAQGTASNTATATVVFPAASGLSVKVMDGTDKVTVISDYRWIIEEDRTFYVDPSKTTNTGGATASTVVPTFGTNFHTSYMPVVATGCTGPLSCEAGQSILGTPVVCDIGNGGCRTTGTQEAAVDPSQVHLDPTKRYYISVLPGDAANPFIDANLTANCANGAVNNTNPDLRCGHGMGGAPIAAVCAVGTAACTGSLAPVTIMTQPAPFPPAKLSVFVFEDDFPLNGEQDAGGGIDVLATHEPGLGHFNITLFDDAGGTGDATGQMTYDMFNQPLVNSLAGTIDPATGLDACPISKNARSGASDPTQTGITGTIVTCPTLRG